jgi:hypothetical protein
MTASDLPPLERLEALEQIRTLKARYCRFIDTKQWQALRGLFSSGARFEGFGSAPDGSDADAFVAGVSSRLAQAVSTHHCHTPEIVLLTPTRARGVWAMQDHLQWPHAIALRELPDATGFVGSGHYEEEYVREEGQWKMAFLRLSRLRIDPLPAGTAFPAGGAGRAPDARWLDPAS